MDQETEWARATWQEIQIGAQIMLNIKLGFVNLQISLITKISNFVYVAWVNGKGLRGWRTRGLYFINTQILLANLLCVLFVYIVLVF